MSTVTAKIPAAEGQEIKSATIEYDFGDNLAAASKLFGDAVVYSQYKAQATVRAQAIIRDGLKKGKTQDEISAIMAGWKPGVKISIAGDPKANFLSLFSTMTPEERKATLAELRASV